MKTLLITLEYPPFNGGVANYYANLAKYWPGDEKIEVLNNNHQELLKEGAGAWLRVVGKLLRRYKISGFDYLLVGQILPLGTAAYLASRIKSFKYGIILHGLDFTRAISRPRKRFLARLILKKADKIICANSRVAQLVIDFQPALAAQVKIVNPGVEPLATLIDLQKVANLKKHYRLEDACALLTLGRLTLRKGVDKVIEALAAPEFQKLKVKYFIAGAGSQEKYLRQLAKASPLGDRIIFLGELSAADKWNWLAACDIFIMPAREIGPDFEGFGIVYLEANLAGKPVIAGASGGVPDAVKHLENGLLVNPESPDEIKQAIIKLAQDKRLSLELGTQGRKRAQTQFNWEKQAQRFCQLIKK